MRRVFEKFARHVFARRQRTFQVKKERSDWSATAADGSDLNLLPHMESDVTLRSADRTIITECKYTESLYENRFFEDKLRPRISISSALTFVIWKATLSRTGRQTEFYCTCFSLGERSFQTMQEKQSTSFANAPSRSRL